MNCGLEEVFEFLMMWFFFRSIGIVLEVNGGWIFLLEEVYVVFRRDRVDIGIVEVMYVSIDNFCMSGIICYEVFNKEEVFVSGILEYLDINCYELLGYGSNNDFIF